MVSHIQSYFQAYLPVLYHSNILGYGTALASTKWYRIAAGLPKLCFPHEKSSQACNKTGFLSFYSLSLGQQAGSPPCN